MPTLHVGQSGHGVGHCKTALNGKRPARCRPRSGISRKDHNSGGWLSNTGVRQTVVLRKYAAVRGWRGTPIAPLSISSSVGRPSGFVSDVDDAPDPDSVESPLEHEQTAGLGYLHEFRRHALRIVKRDADAVFARFCRSDAAFTVETCSQRSPHPTRLFRPGLPLSYSPGSRSSPRKPTGRWRRRARVGEHIRAAETRETWRVLTTRAASSRTQSRSAVASVLLDRRRRRPIELGRGYGFAITATASR